LAWKSAARLHAANTACTSEGRRESPGGKKGFPALAIVRARHQHRGFLLRNWHATLRGIELVSKPTRVFPCSLTQKAPSAL
jgi:hypothetical protein